MDRVEYPEKARRESMLWAVHEWFQRQADYTPILRYYEVESMGIPVGADATTDAERQKAHRLNLFIRLVHEGYIDAELRREFVGGPPITSAVVRGLTERGLLEIGELPDADRRLEQSLDALKSQIEALTDVPEDRKETAANAVEELKRFARGLAPGVALELGKAYLRGRGIPL